MTAAVSARSTLRPKPTVGRPDASSSVLHPPSGPTATTRWAPRRPVAAQLRQHDLARRRRAPPGRRRRIGVARPRAARPGGTGPPPRGPPGAAAPPRPGRARRSSAPRCARSRSGTMRSMPNSVSFWTTHSGRSPLTGAKATVSAGSARASDCTAPSPPTPAGGRSRPSSAHAAPAARAQRPRPSPTMTSSPAPQAQHPAQVMGVLVGEDRVRRVVHEDLGRPRRRARRWRRRSGAGASQRQSAGARTRPRRPAPGGDTCSPRGRGELAQEFVLLGARARSASPPARARRGRPGPGRAGGARRGRGSARRTRAGCPAPIVSVLGARRASPPRPRCRGRPGPCRWSAWCAGCRPGARSAGRA